jgi:hypothetical protein
MKKVRNSFALTFILMLSIQTLRGGSATWSANTISGDWNTAANWIPAAVTCAYGGITAFANNSTAGEAILTNNAGTGLRSGVTYSRWVSREWGSTK